MQVWDVDGKQALTTYNLPGSVQGASWSKDEKRILSWSEEGTVQVWDVDGNQALTAYKHPGSVQGASWSKDEKRILSRSQDGTVQVWDVDGKQSLIAYKHPGWVGGASWSKDEKRILSWSADGTFHRLDLTTSWGSQPPGTPEADLTLEVKAHTGMRLDQTGAWLPSPASSGYSASNGSRNCRPKVLGDPGQLARANPAAGRPQSSRKETRPCPPTSTPCCSSPSPIAGIPVSEHLFARRTTTTARLTDDAEAMGNDLDPVLCTVGPATGGVLEEFRCQSIFSRGGRPRRRGSRTMPRRWEMTSTQSSAP